MKKTAYYLLVSMAILIIACNNPKMPVVENPYIGAWEITYSKFVYPDTTYESMQVSKPYVKLLTKKHYAFGKQSDINSIAGGGGEYRFSGDVFVSYPKYHFASYLVGDSLVMKSKIEGDLWTISYTFKNDTLKIEATEIWKRIQE